MITAGVNIYASYASCNSLFYTATRKGHVNIMHALIAAGCDIDSRDDDGRTPIFITAMRGYADIVAAGADIDAIDENKRSPMHIAVEAGHIDIALALIEAGANIHNENYQRRNALIAAGGDINAKDEYNGISAIFAAAQEGHIDTVHALIGAIFIQRTMMVEVRSLYYCRARLCRCRTCINSSRVRY